MPCPTSRKRWRPAGKANSSVPRTPRRSHRPTSTCARRRSTAGRTKCNATSSRRRFWAEETEMDFDFTDDQSQLRDAVHRWVEKGYDFEKRRAIVKAGGFDRNVYNQLAELGLTGLYIP